MKRFALPVIVALVLTSLFAGLVFLVVFQAQTVQRHAQAPQGQVNPTPQVIPSLREWHGGSGAFALTPTSRIVLDTATGDQLADTARVFATDLSLITGRALPIVQ